jgi:O-antigen ligase
LLGPKFILRGIDYRQELFSQSVEIFKNSPYVGIGFNNFFVHQVPLIKTISPIIFQPVHNIFVLALLSLGLLGFWIFPAIFFLAIQVLRKKLKTKNEEVRDFYKSVLFLVIAIIVAGMFDHFFLTLEQGQLMLALILGLSFSKI